MLPYFRAVTLVLLVACGYQRLPLLAVEEDASSATTDGSAGSDGSDGAACNAPGPCATGGVCDTAIQACVACVDDTACADVTPICHNDACIACTSNSQCESDACLPTGACADQTAVAYVNPSDGSGTTCTMAAPCATLAAGLASGRSYIRLTGTASESLSVNSGTRTIIGTRAGGVITSSISLATSVPLISVSGSASVALVDIALIGSSGNNSGAVVSNGKLSLSRCTVNHFVGTGISASGGEVDVSQSVISNNEHGGLVFSSATYHVINTIIFGNGAAGVPVGGVYLSQGSGTIDFSTITANVGNTAGPFGLYCSLSAGTITNTIISNNTIPQVSSSECTYAYSNVYPPESDAPSGNGNNSLNPMLDQTFHLTATSPMIDAANPNSTVTVDFDGDIRPQGNGPDIGADEHGP